MTFIILITLAAVCAGMGGYMVGRRNRLSNADRKAYVEHRRFVSNLQRLAAQNAATEPFAVIVMDEVHTFMTEQNRSIK